MMIGGTTIGIGVGIRRPSLPGGFLKRRPSVPGFVGGWKTYSKNNADLDRDILKDYSGNGRDIKLYNFAFAGMSGYGGFVYDESNVIITSSIKDYATIEGNRIEVKNLSDSYTFAQGNTISGEPGQPLTINVPSYRVKVTGLSEGQRIDIGFGYNDGVNQTWVSSVFDTPVIIEDGTYTIPAFTLTIQPANETAVCKFNPFRPYNRNATPENPSNFVIEILPLYPGGLISDGVDDCGECIKSFSLPDDYTVVAIRKTFNTGSDSALASKSRTAGQGAFIFDINGGGYSYGNISSGAYNAPLFSYQTKTSYNGVVISPGSGMDTEDDTLCLFKKGVARGDYLPAVLYDLRIYDHSLTEEELQTVKDEMMADYENATGGV